MNINLPKILSLVKNNKLDDSIKEINKISNHDKNFKLIELKGFIYFNLKEYEQSYDCYSKAINLDENSFNAFAQRGTISFELGKFTEAINDFKKCFEINKKSNIALENIGKCYSNLGDNAKAIKYYNLALELDANNKRLIETIAEKLTEIGTIEDKNNKIVKINSAIKNIKYNYSSEVKIDNNEIKKLINKSENLINKNFGNLNFNQTQIFRKNNFDLNCDRHFLIFRNHKIIPKFCFSCIKVTINLDNVVDLIKLFIILENINLPNNNLRKCMIDLRSDSKSNYKAFIYCRSNDEAEEIRKKLNKIIKLNISKNLSFNIKRGCSEFNKKYAGFENSSQNLINYNLEWKKYEDIIDKKFPKFKFKNKKQETIKGISFYDIMIIKNWLFFAYLINDKSYKLIQEKTTTNFTLEKIVRQNKLNP
tara:strand:- start:1442 stop:2707 length:1266 start_codon:yes stop_codon:yes gene_type:complete